MTKQKVIWQCAKCGNEQLKWTGSCSVCNSWNTFEQYKTIENVKRYQKQNDSKIAKPVKLKDVDIQKFYRITTDMIEIDRLLGGGIVTGSLVLIGGEPGIGKSTLLLQLSSLFAKQNKKVLYVCGEESVEQTSLRAKRLSIIEENLYLFNETSFERIKENIDTLQPQFLIIDSIQILYKENIPSAPGSVVQVREVTLEFMHIAKSYGITVFLIGHVTKTGDLAGPRVLEHMVDVVLNFEGERQLGFRLLRSIKNRFGPTDDIALFQMKEQGLVEVPNPSSVFLEQRNQNTSGSAIVPTIEGARSILIEAQALVTASVFPSPSRKCTGMDVNRLSLLLAVLEKRLGYRLYQYDVFVSIAGGIRIIEPAIDLAMTLAIASSFTNVVLHKNTIAIGEIGLAGEIRRVNHIESRLKEAYNMGFTKCILPKKNMQEIANVWQKKMQLIPVDLVDEAIRYMI